MACVLLASATLRLAPEARNPVALALLIEALAPSKAAPTPTKRFTPVRSIVSRSADTVSLAVTATKAVALVTTNDPLASTYPPRFKRITPLTTRVASEVSVRIGFPTVVTTEDQSIATAGLPPTAPEAVLYFTLRFFTSTVKVSDKPTALIEAALAAMPVQRRVSLAPLLLAIATLRLARSALKPVALPVTKVEVSPSNLAPTPTKRFTPVRSIVSRSAAAPARVTLLLPKVKEPAANT